MPVAEEKVRQWSLVPSDDPVLRRTASPVAKPGKETMEIVREMIDIMHEKNGVGLAAPQIGLSQQIIVVDIGKGAHVLFNPKILKAEGEQVGLEGCLSLPRLEGMVNRAQKVLVKALDRHGRPVKVKGEGFMARVLQHEIDHLNGVLFIDKVEPGTLRLISEDEIEQRSAEAMEPMMAGGD
ncbi:MAG: peptide deformylase [Armatimonadetes bacterium]|nr:peptide deformylase [Armatimonadota bacterium]